MEKHKKEHDYHLVDLSIWPIATSFSLLLLVIGGVMFMHKVAMGKLVLILGILAILKCMHGWWKDVVKEAIQDKAHTKAVQTGLRIGMALFILTEVMFFGAFFSSLFKFSLDPVDILDGGIWGIKQGIWPPEGIKTINPWDLPLINTLILLLSGTTVTWAHYAILEENKKEATQALGISVLLGIVFSSLQILEYAHASFGFSQDIYSSNFYMATGFHGFHVLIGTIFLAVCYFRSKKGHFSKDSHLGFEFAAWYWHFVDVVWLFLFVFLYVWGR